MNKHNVAYLRAFYALERFIDLRGKCPTIDELAAELGINRISAFEQLQKLERLGYISREKYQLRGTRILKRPARRSTLLSVAGETDAAGTIHMGTT